MTNTPNTPDSNLDEQYRDDVRELLEAEGWRETAEDCVVADNGALWTETNTALDSGVDAPDKSWSVSFDSNVPANVIAAVALVAAGTDLVAEVRRLRARVAELEAYAHGCDAEGCVLPHSSWCERAKKTAAENNGCTCGQPWIGHPQPHAMHCWTVNPPRAEVEQMRRALAEVRTKTLVAEADEIVAHCPDHGTRDGVWVDCHCAVADDMRRRAAAGPVVEETHVVADDSNDPEHIDDCPGCDGTRPCGHDDYHDPHEWADRPGVWCPGISYADDEPAAATP